MPVSSALVDGLAEQMICGSVSDEEVPTALARVCERAASVPPTRDGLDGCARNVDTADLETTLTFAIVATAAGDRRCVIGWVGDSPAMELREGRWRRLGSCRKGNGGIESSLTEGVFSSPAPTVRRGVLNEGTVLVLCTDGVGNFISDGASTFALGERLAEAWRKPVDVLTFANQVSFDLPTADDDRTAVVVWALDEPV